ncbi:hypothetical protein [Streptomyces sp. NPDC088183]|uniref:hypothetical protein n=1 Tax=Streptomyces sp. NPDC088183 TaxID=3160992 RepID=UPI00341740ED
MIQSTGGKLLRVYTHDDEVVLDWIDPTGSDGDALLSPSDARALADWLARAADLVDGGPALNCQTIEGLDA